MEPCCKRPDLQSRWRLSAPIEDGGTKFIYRVEHIQCANCGADWKIDVGPEGHNCPSRWWARDGSIFDFAVQPLLQVTH